MAGAFSPRVDTLPLPQQRLWAELREIPASFTLYGGTALALHLGHRQSVDFDFFGSEAFDPDTLLSSLPLLRGSEVVQRQSDTLTCILDRDGPVQVSFFGVPGLRRLRPPLIVEDTGLRVAWLLDLAGAKVSVLQKRAAAKDYIDIDALIRHGVSLPMALAAGAAIYGAAFNPQITLKALTYFDDGDLRSLPAELRARLLDAVRGVDLDHLPDPLQDGPS